MKVIQLIPYLKSHSSGLTTFMQAFCRSINTRVDVELLAFHPIAPGLFDTIKKKEFFNSSPILSIIGWCPSLYSYLKHKVQDVDIIHTHNLWLFPNIYPEFARRGTNCKIVMTPHGTLTPYALNRSSWKKKIMLRLGQRTALEKADLLIATCQEELMDIRRFGLDAPVAVIPVGVEILSEHHISAKKIKKIVFLSRIDHKKGVELLVRTWQKLSVLFPDWELCIAGPLHTEYAYQMQTLAKELQCERLSFVGELLGRKKTQFLSEASCFVLPTFSENFGIAIAESLMCGTPVITTKGAPWEGLVTHHAGWWIEPNSEEALIASMSEAMSTPLEELQQMGRSGREWVLSEFSWETVAQKYAEAYRWLLGQVKKPEYIYVE